MKKTKDESKKHENAESMKSEGKETMMEKKGYKETTSGKMVKAAKGALTKSQKKIGKVMREFKSGKLHSGKKGPVVKNPKQAVAIALSEAGKSKLKVKKAAMGSMMNYGRGQSRFLGRQGMQQPQQGLAGMPGIRTLPVSQPQQPANSLREVYGQQPTQGGSLGSMLLGQQPEQNPSGFNPNMYLQGGNPGIGRPGVQPLPSPMQQQPAPGGMMQQPQMAKKGKMISSKNKKKGGGVAERGMGQAFSEGGAVRGVRLATRGFRPAKLY
jgi:hypothetical protein